MENETIQSKTDKSIEIVKTLEKKAPETTKQVKSIQKEQEKYKEFLKKQPQNRYGYIETKTASTV